MQHVFTRKASCSFRPKAATGLGSSRKMIVALVSVLAAGYSLGSGVTPTQKVISMMQEMKAKGEAEKEKEAKLYAEYMTWSSAGHS